MNLSGHQSALNYLKTLPSIENVGISMTKIPKLGINPMSQYQATPIGVYFYPADYYMDRIQQGQSLPFGHDAPHINIFHYDGNVWNLSGQDQTTAKQIAKRLKIRLSSKISDSYLVWQKLGGLATNPIKWNKLIREQGIDVVVDNGDSIIHDAEPHQGVVLNPRVISIIARIDNQRIDQNTAKSLRNRAWFDIKRTTSIPQFNDVMRTHLLGLVEHAPRLGDKFYDSLFSKAAALVSTADAITQVDMMCKLLYRLVGWADLGADFKDAITPYVKMKVPMTKKAWVVQCYNDL